MPQTKVLSVAVTKSCHSPLHQPKQVAKTAGKSEIKWECRGVYFANEHCVVVVQAEKQRSGAGGRVNSYGNGGVFPEGADGAYCELTFEGNDMENWALSVATEGDTSSNDGLIFTAGSGGAGQ